MLRKKLLFLRLVAFSVTFFYDALKRAVARRARKLRAKIQKPTVPKSNQVRNVVVIGASFAGYHVARVVAASLPFSGQYRVVVIEPNSHFQFTWVLPRFCVIPDNEHKAFIPYGPYIIDAAPESVLWIRDRVTSIEQKVIRLHDGEDVPYDYCVIATGSGFGMGLPSRVGETSKAQGIERLREMQAKIKNASKIVVVGGGAAGTELVMDAKGLYPEKNITLVHSRQAPMSRFGPELQSAALEWLKKLEVNVVLGERMVSEDDASITLSSGRKIECDLMVSTKRF
jgi:NADH dehydrogenase FAD-containing subunit